jgi:hypothetical protein
MSTLTQSLRDVTTTDRAIRRSLRTEHMSARRPSAQRVADAVMASYIHDISQRSRRSVRAASNHAPRPTPD